MSGIKAIRGAIGAILALYVLLSSIPFYATIVSDSAGVANGDPNALSDAMNATANEAVESIQWSVGMTLVIAIAGAIGVPAGIIAVLKRNS